MIITIVNQRGSSQVIFLILAIGVIFVLTLLWEFHLNIQGLIYSTYNLPQLKQVQQSSQKNLLPSPSPEILQSVIYIKQMNETSDWKTFSIESLRFKIPQSWGSEIRTDAPINQESIVFDPVKSKATGKALKYQIVVSKNTTLYERQQVLIHNYKLSTIKIQNVNWSNFQGIVVTGISAVFNPTDSDKTSLVLFTVGNNVYSFEDSGISKDDGVFFNKIISTFELSS